MTVAFVQELPDMLFSPNYITFEFYLEISIHSRKKGNNLFSHLFIDY